MKRTGIITIIGGALLAAELLRRRKAVRMGRARTAFGLPRGRGSSVVDFAPGVPPEHNLDYVELLDIEGAMSFPASDPPSGW